jgi:3-methyladenine DNA glycosylase AlkC
MAESTATADKKSNGSPKGDYPNSEAWTTWPGMSRAAKTLGVSMKRLRDMVTFGEIQAHHGSDGTIRFRPVWLDEYIEDRDGIPDDEVDVDPKKSDKAASREGIPADAIRATAELLRSSQSQNLELHRLVLQGFKAATEAQDVTIQRLLERQSQYESIITDLLKAREMYFDAQLEREVMRNQHVAAQKRRDELFEVTKGWAGEIIQGLKHKYGLDEESSEKVRAAIELLKALTPEQIEVGAMMGFFSAEQIDLIEKIIGRKIPRPSGQGNDASQASSKNTESAGAADSSSAAPANPETPPAQAGKDAGATPAPANESE